MSRHSAIDEPVELGVLLREHDLEEVAQYHAQMHDRGIIVLDRLGDGSKVAVAVGGVEFSVVEQLPVDEGAIIVDRQAYFRAPICYQGAKIGEVIVGPIDAAGDAHQQEAERSASLGGHVAHIVEVLAHSAYQRYLTSVMHVAAMEEAYSGLQKKNRQLSEAIERLEEADRLKSAFLATVSHELRTPLTSVIGYSEMLVEGLAGPLEGEQKEYVQIVLSKADQLLQLITGLLDASLLEAGQLQISRQAVELPSILAAVAAGFVPQARQRKITVEVADYSGPRADGDERKIRQVLWNLVANAIKFTPHGGRVSIEASVGPMSPRADAGRFGLPDDNVEADDLGVRLRVVDDGIGISPEKQRHIFEPFFQVDSSSTREYGGTGLGLTLAKRYVEAHGGQIWADSQLGKGSTFTVSLPAVQADLAGYLRARRAESSSGEPQ